MLMIETAGGGHPALARLEPSDGELLRRLFYRLSPESLHRRFMSPIARPEQVRPERLLDIEHRDREAIVAVVDGEIVGVARYARRPPADTADIAVVVADAWQRQGIATRLLRALADHAEGVGIRRFALTVQADNRGALALLRRLAPRTRPVLAQGVYEAAVAVEDA
jgi:RimJ/RimL family protein N-acetyltransferase